MYFEKEKKIFCTGSLKFLGHEGSKKGNWVTSVRINEAIMFLMAYKLLTDI